VIRALLLVVVLAPLTAAAQAMYKWVDEKGVTHFSESPPPDGKATKIEVKPPPAAQSRPDDWKERELESRRRKADQDTVAGEQRRREDAQRGERCRQAQVNLDNYRNTRRIYSLDAKGERVYMPDDERPAAIARATDEVGKYCK
jgi:hypothetical protein